MPETMTSYTYVESPVGRLLLAGDADVLTLISFPDGKGARQPLPHWQRNDRLFTEAIRQLEEYFAGTRKEFSMPLQMIGTDFQKSVWFALRGIPFGVTVSYGEIARRIGRPKASRAVGAANGANPIPIVVPCHRVIGADKSLTGFGGGLDTKRFLLKLENVQVPAITGQQELFSSHP